MGGSKGKLYPVIDIHISIVKLLMYRGNFSALPQKHHKKLLFSIPPSGEFWKVSNPIRFQGACPSDVNFVSWRNEKYYYNRLMKY